MSVIKKLVTLLRGSARELGQSVVDGNATRIYEQEIIDAKSSITEAKTELTGVMAKQMQTARDIERIKADLLRHEDLAVQALNKAEEGLALEVAERVAGLETELNAQTQAHASYAMQVSRLKDLIRAAETRVREHEREIGIAKTTESVYRATRSISENLGSGGAPHVGARESLERIRNNAGKMGGLINDLLAYSRVAARGKPFGKVDMGALLATVVDDLEARLAA